MSHRDNRRYYSQDRGHNQRWNTSQSTDYIPRRSYETDPKDANAYVDQRQQRRPRDTDYRGSGRSHEERRMSSTNSNNRYNNERGSNEARYVYERGFDEDIKRPSQSNRFDRPYDNRHYEEPQQGVPIFQCYGPREQNMREDKEIMMIHESSAFFDPSEAIYIVNQQRKFDPPIQLFTAPYHTFESWD